MALSRIKLKVLLPFQVFSENSNVIRLVAETQAGSFGFLPNRLDCVAALTPGILVIETDDQDEVYVAIDEGVLVKTGREVSVSVRNAIGGTKLSELRDAVEQEFLSLSEHEESVRAVLARMEGGLFRRLAEFHHE